MELFIVSLHVVLCLAMILIILLQPGKGGDVGAAFGGGGGGGSMFGPRGPASLLSKATTGAAVMFMMTCMTLAWYANQNNKGRVGGTTGEEDATQELFAPVQQDTEAPTPEAVPTTPEADEAPAN